MTGATSRAVDKQALEIIFCSFPDLNRRHEVEDADDGDEVEVDPRSVAPEPDVLVEDGGHVLQGGVLAQTVQPLFDPVN